MPTNGRPLVRGKDAAREEALVELRALCPPGTTVYTILRSVSRSGMSREIGVAVFKDGHPFHPNYYTATVLGMRHGREGVVSKGCGFNHAATLVSDLSDALYGSPDALKHQAL